MTYVNKYGTGDASGCDTIHRLKAWYDELLAKGPLYGYYPSPTKCIVVVKPEKIELALKIFKGTGIDVTTDGSKDCAKDTGVEINTQGTRHLGAAVGTPSFKRAYATAKINTWVSTVKAEVEPHAAFTAFTRSLQCQWTFLSRVMEDISSLFEPLENAIHMVFIKALIKRDASAVEWDMLALPARRGGLGIFNPVDTCKLSHASSKYICAPLVQMVTDQDRTLNPLELLDKIRQLRQEVDIKNEERCEAIRAQVLSAAAPALQMAVQAASEKGASSWVTALSSFDNDSSAQSRLRRRPIHTLQLEASEPSTAMRM